MYAVIKTGAKQYKVTEGDVLSVEKSRVIKELKLFLTRF